MDPVAPRARAPGLSPPTCLEHSPPHTCRLPANRLRSGRSRACACARLPNALGTCGLARLRPLRGGDSPLSLPPSPVHAGPPRWTGSPLPHTSRLSPLQPALPRSPPLERPQPEPGAHPPPAAQTPQGDPHPGTPSNRHRHQGARQSRAPRLALDCSALDRKSVV